MIERTFGKLLKQRFSGVRILIAEDDAFNRLLADQLLKDTGLELVFIENGQEAVEKVGAQPFGLVLMDIQMPELNGLEAKRLIRPLPGYADTPIIAMTANSFNEDRQACVDAGMNDHLSKPVVQEKLFGRLQKWL